MGWYCLFDRGEAKHEAARAVIGRLARTKTPLVTTDYVVDETATLLVARKAADVLGAFLATIENSVALRVVAVGSARFREACTTMLKHKDQGYSFTDVTSVIVMREMRLDEVLTDDRLFEKAGFRRLL